MNFREFSIRSRTNRFFHVDSGDLLGKLAILRLEHVFDDSVVFLHKRDVITIELREESAS